MSSEPGNDSPGRRRSPSQLDVARVAGVSGQTVSRVANGLENVDEMTRQRVVAAMREVGYRPNSAARALRSGAFRSIGVIVFELSSVGATRTLEGISVAAQAAGYTITLLQLSDQSQPDVTGAFHRLSEQSVDGVIILLEAHRIDEADVLLPDGLPVVVVDSSASYPYPVVDSDQVDGARLATEHLLGLGHETVWHLAGPRASFSAERRCASWSATLRRHGRRVPPVRYGDWTAGSGYAQGRALAADPSVTAIFAANDQMALGVLRAIHESGRRVPGDLSVVGFDDIDEAASFWPPLTTVRQTFSEVGRLGVAALLSGIRADGLAPQRTIVPTELIVRGSTAPPATT